MSFWASQAHAFHQPVCQRLSWLHHWSVPHVHTIGVFWTYFSACHVRFWNSCFFMGSPVLADIPTQFFYGIWACALFPHLGSVLCRCPYKERIVRQTTTARTPSHQPVDDCCLALPPSLWQPRYPEGGEATVIEGSLTFPHWYWVSQLDAVLRHTQDFAAAWQQRPRL